MKISLNKTLKGSMACAVLVMVIGFSFLTLQGPAFGTYEYREGVLVAPATSDIWVSGRTYSILWNTVPAVPLPDLYYSTDGGATWILIAGGVTNDGTYPWLVPAAISTCMINIKYTDQWGFKYQDTHTFQITPPSTISLSPSSFSFSAQAGGTNPASKTLTISNSGGGTLNWSVLEEASWLTLSPASGTNTGSVTLSVNTSGLSAGPYPATITIRAPLASNSPRYVSVNLTVSDPLIYTVSGTITSNGVGIGGVSIGGTYTNFLGQYSISVYEGTQINLYPQLSGWSFSPQSVLMIVNSNRTQSFTGTAVTTLVVTPTTDHTFVAAVGGAIPPTEAVTISIGNGQSGTNYDWTAEKTTASWLKLNGADTASGNITGGGTGTVTLSVNQAGLGIGSREATVTVSSNDVTPDYSSKTFKVTLIISSLSVSPNSMFFQANLRGGDPPNQKLTITKAGGDSASWTISVPNPPPSWLTVSPASGTSNPTMTVEVSVCTRELPAGDYYATMHVISLGNPDIPVTVHMNIGDPLYIESVSPNRGPTGIWTSIQGNSKLNGSTRIEFVKDGVARQAMTSFVNGVLTARVPCELKAETYDIRATNPDEQYTFMGGYTVSDAPAWEDPYCRPNPFDPTKGTVITFTLANNVNAKLLVYNSTGKLAWRKDGIIGDGSQKNILFDGKDGFGKFLANGPYYIILVADGKALARGEMCAFQ